MRLHPEEMELARAYTDSHTFESLRPEQIKIVTERGRRLREWFQKHHGLHNLISGLVLAFIFLLDYWALLRMPLWFLPEGRAHSTGIIVLAALLAGSLHSTLMYSLSVYSMHEGAAHKWIFVGRWKLVRAANWMAGNLCRLAACDPNYYSGNHAKHHARFGTESDGEFLNYVRPRRFWITLLPLGAFTNFSDFLAHRAETYTRSRIVTAVFTIAFNGIYAYLAYRAFGGLFTLIAMVLCFPHVGFYLDRLRQFTEHNLMPLDNINGSRSLGCGFWGLRLEADPGVALPLGAPSGGWISLVPAVDLALHSDGSIDSGPAPAVSY